MTTLSIQPPYPLITDIDGQPLEDGYIWIGAANLPPIGNPIAVYWDAALTIPAAQPIRTRGGYPVNAGTPARLYVGSDYSILVQNKNGSAIYSAPAATERLSDVVVTGIDSSEVTFLQAGSGAVVRTAQSKMRDAVSVFDYIPPSEHAAIQAGTSTYDCTAAIAQAIANNSAVVGQPYGYEKVIVFPEGWYSVQHIDLTNRRNVWLWAEGYVLIKGINSSTKNFIFGSTNFNPSNPAASTQTPECFLGGPGQWEFFAAPGTSYQYGMRLEHFTSSHFENVSAGSGYVPVTDVNGATGSVVAAYMQYTYSNLFINCGFSCPAAPPVGNKSYGLFMDNNNVNSNTFIRCNWQAANVAPAPFSDTIGAWLSGTNNVLDQCDLSGLATAIVATGRGHQIRNIYSEYVTTFLSGPPTAGTLDGCVVQGGIIEIANNGQAFYPKNTQNLTIIGGFYKGAFAGTKTFIDQTAGTLYGLICVGPYLNPGDFANTTSGTYRNPDALAHANVLQAKWLTFPSTAQPSAEPNTLDDYEEGTWTPTKTTGTAYTSASGRYTKVGNLVTATFIVQFAVETNASSSEMSGFPFSAVGSASDSNGLAVGYQSSSIQVGGSLSTTTMTFRQIGTGVVSSATITQMSGALVSGTITYTI